MKIRERQKLLGLKDKEVAQALPRDKGSIDTLRKLHKFNLSDEILDLYEEAVERARLNRIKRLQTAG